jgi:hypothetical protein
MSLFTELHSDRLSGCPGFAGQPRSDVVVVADGYTEAFASEVSP